LAIGDCGLVISFSIDNPQSQITNLGDRLSVVGFSFEIAA
jgi:hypothetical protein